MAINVNKIEQEISLYRIPLTLTRVVLYRGLTALTALYLIQGAYSANRLEGKTLIQIC